MSDRRPAFIRSECDDDEQDGCPKDSPDQVPEHLTTPPWTKSLYNAGRRSGCRIGALRSSDLSVTTTNRTAAQRIRLIRYRNISPPHRGRRAYTTQGADPDVGSAPCVHQI